MGNIWKETSSGDVFEFLREQGFDTLEQGQGVYIFRKGNDYVSIYYVRSETELYKKERCLYTVVGSERTIDVPYIGKVAERTSKASNETVTWWNTMQFVKYCLGVPDDGLIALARSDAYNNRTPIELWRSANGKWLICESTSERPGAIYVTNGVISDWPILQKDGLVSYERPEFVPNYVNDIARQILHQRQKQS